MRNLLIGSSLFAVAALVGCGGDDGHIKVPDAKVFKDSAIDAPHMCLSMASLGSGSVGSSTAPAMGQYFYKDSMTMTPFWGIKIKMNSDAAPDVVYFIVDEPAAGYVTGVPYAFTTDPTAMVPYAFTTDPTAMTAAAVSFLDTDVDASGNTTQELWPQPGTPAAGINFSAIMKTATGKITATINMTTYKEIDDNGALVAGGCTSTMTGLNLFLQQNAAPPARTISPTDTTNPSGTARTQPILMTKEEFVRSPDVPVYDVHWE